MISPKWSVCFCGCNNCRLFQCNNSNKYHVAFTSSVYVHKAGGLFCLGLQLHLCTHTSFISQIDRSFIQSLFSDTWCIYYVQIHTFTYVHTKTILYIASVSLISTILLFSPNCIFHQHAFPKKYNDLDLCDTRLWFSKMPINS